MPRYLAHARRFRDALARRDTDAFPIMDGMPLPELEEAARQLASWVRRESPTLDIPPRVLEHLVDETIMTSEREGLSPPQLALCAVLLFDAFIAEPALSRCSPDIEFAMRDLVRAFPHLPPRAILILAAQMRQLERLSSLRGEERPITHAAHLAAEALCGRAIDDRELRRAYRASHPDDPVFFQARRDFVRWRRNHAS